MLDRIITYSFYTLFFLTPLFWTPLNYELFEYNKMILTYGLTTIIVGTWLLKMINQKTFIFKRTPLDIPLLLFLGANALSTIFSIDTHTSIWGYYSRSNGGLLSIISYLSLYWAFVSNIDKSKIKTLLKVGLLSGFIISLWGIFEHFGISPSCVILRGEFNASCWIQDVQARVFATLGQPNWMAAYLAMLIFPALYFLLTSKTRSETIRYTLLTIIYYLAFTFTYSRGPTLGLISGIVVFLSLSFWRERQRLLHFVRSRMTIVLITFLVINLLFGSALTSFRLVSKFAPPPRPVIGLPTTSVTQLETGGTESGQIRFIVWQGALDIFRHYPVFGSGVETFAYSYYNFRPQKHNLTSEWDFLYNKAHNEYLNYLATTGIVGFGAYMGVIFTFVMWSIKRIMNKESRINKFVANAIKLNSYSLILTAILASYITYLVYNFFLFSVVVIALSFYLFPAIAFVATDSTRSFKFPKTIPHTLNPIPYLYRRPLYIKLAKGLVIFSIIYLLFSIFQLWYADTLFAKGERASELGNPGRAYNLLISASSVNPHEPFFRSELAYSAAQAAVSLKDEDASLSASLKDEALREISKVLESNPKNVSFWRTAIRTYFEISAFDKIYTQKTLEAVNRAIQLAPTDPKLYYNKALILESIDKKEQALEALKKALELKPNYLEVKEKLDEINSQSN